MPKLNLGCGGNIKKGWINIDLYSDGPDIVKMDVRKLEYPDGFAEEIWAQMVIEHISWKETDDVLKEWYRVLKKGGRILVVDWKEGVTFGPKEKVSPEEVKKIASEINLKLEKEFEAGSFHYGLVFTKP